MARPKIADINKIDTSYDQLIGLLTRYGFERTRAAGHQTFEHREYREQIGPISIPVKHGNAMDAGMVRQSLDACRQVKALNKLKREGGADNQPLPVWLERAFDHGFECERAGNKMRITHASNGSPARSFSVKSNYGTLYIVSNDCPDLPLLRFNPKPGDRKPIEGLKRMFSELDAQVCERLSAPQATQEEVFDALMQESPTVAPAPYWQTPAPAPSPAGVSEIQNLTPERGPSMGK